MIVVILLAIIAALVFVFRKQLAAMAKSEADAIDKGIDAQIKAEEAAKDAAKDDQKP